MEISLSLSSHSIPRTSPSSSSSLSISSFNSAFFNNGRSLLLKKNNNSNCLVLSRKNRARRGFNCRCLFGLGVPELVVIAGVAALVFGPKKLPEVGKSLGKTIKSFQQAAKEFESELKKGPDPTLEEPPAEKPIAVSEQEKQDTKIEQEKQDTKISSTEKC